MATNSNRSSGSQHNARGVTQGVTLVDPKTGLPVAVILGEDGKYRLAVDANVTATIGEVTVDLDGVGPQGDSVYLVDNVTGNKFKVNADGSIDANVEVDAAGGDSVMTVGTEDGTPTGTQHTTKIDSDGNTQVKDTAAGTKLDSILSELQQKTEPSDAQNIRPLSSATDSVTVPGVATEAKQDTAITVLESIDDKLDGPIPVIGSVSIGDLDASKDDVAIAGTENGLATGTVRHFVNNRRQQILAAHDRQQVITYADFGTKDQRVTAIAYTSPTFPGITALKTFSYSLVGIRYRRDNITWSIV